MQLMEVNEIIHMTKVFLRVTEPTTDLEWFHSDCYHLPFDRGSD